ncbi:MAG: hypothetical protein HXY40_07705 [Chloroflexi bacterium]|nr:hypothetical protein [Chloroflexota bacterium]
MAEDDTQSRMQLYRELVLRYEKLDEEIDAFIAKHGSVDQMATSYLAKYRALARQREDLQNEMRFLERQLKLDDDQTT